jgi:hypothetical protein
MSNETVILAWQLTNVFTIEYSHTYQDTMVLKLNLNLEDKHPLVLRIELCVIIFSSLSTQRLQWDAVLSGVSSVSRSKMINIFIIYSRDSLDSTSTIKYRLFQCTATMKCDWYHAYWIDTTVPGHWRDD